ncbi:MAG: ABC transporter ATP-binding protein/permease [Treponema sp.]|jgi:ATP-binding cassette subfamily B protein|nr:ABC transporter ATP-binding protein/permease [Treponema sp.]
MERPSAAQFFLHFKTLFPYLKEYRRQYILGFIFLVIVDAAQVMIPQFTRRAVDFIASGSFRIGDVLVQALAMVALMALICLGRYLWRYFIHGSSRRIETEMRRRLFDHLLTLSYDFYQDHKIGDLMARATNDINAVRMAMGWGLVALVDGTIMAASILVIIFIQDARTAAFAVLPLPFITILILLFGRTVGKRFRRVHESYSAMSDTAQETFAGIRVIKSFVKEWWFTKKFAGTNDDYRQANMALVKLYGFFFPFISFLSGLTSLILLLAGGIRVAEGLMSPGDLVALFSYLQMLIWPLMGAGFMVNMIQRGAVALARVNEVMDTVPAIRSPPPEEAAVPAESGVLRKGPLVEFRGLSFAYPKGVRALDDISLTIEEGTIVGILGRTGSGKSTLIKTLVRLIDPPRGTVFVKGLEVSKWDLKELRRIFGVTPQDSYLFSDSIRNNVAYGLEGAGEQRLIETVKIAAIDQDLAGFGRGWDTLIGERGLTLSGGQKQRVAIARALAGGAELLILDDAFSAVDAETEKRILRGILDERRERLSRGNPFTVIIISHRVSALRHAGKILVLDKGRVAEYGAPEELAGSGGFYAKTASLQRLEGAGGGNGV